MAGSTTAVAVLYGAALLHPLRPEYPAVAVGIAESAEPDDGNVAEPAASKKSNEKLSRCER